jgi:hypothetical protein
MVTPEMSNRQALGKSDCAREIVNAPLFRQEEFERLKAEGQSSLEVIEMMRKKAHGPRPKLRDPWHGESKRLIGRTAGRTEVSKQTSVARNAVNSSVKIES